jgi:hypothetical protein
MASVRTQPLGQSSRRSSRRPADGGELVPFHGTGITPLIAIAGQTTKPTVAMVLAGWHRGTRCLRLGIAARLVVDLPGGVAPWDFVMSRNLHRRHMNASQRALAVVAGSEWKLAGNPRNVTPGATFTNEQLAAESDTSPRTIRQAKIVAAQATPEVVEAVKSGEISLKAALSTRPSHSGEVAHDGPCSACPRATSGASHPVVTLSGGPRSARPRAARPSARYSRGDRRSGDDPNRASDQPN